MIATLMANRYKKDGVLPFHVEDFMPHADDVELTLDDLKNWS